MVRRGLPKLSQTIVGPNAGPHTYLCGRTNGQGRGVHSVDDVPRNAVDATNALVGKLVEGGRREIEVAVGASLAAVCQLDLNRDALVYSR